MFHGQNEFLVQPTKSPDENAFLSGPCRFLRRFSVVPFWSPVSGMCDRPVGSGTRRNAPPVDKGTKRGPERCSPELERVTARVCGLPRSSRCVRASVSAEEGVGLFRGGQNGSGRRRSRTRLRARRIVSLRGTGSSGSMIGTWRARRPFGGLMLRRPAPGKHWRRS